MITIHNLFSFVCSSWPVIATDSPEFMEPVQNVSVALGREAILQCLVKNIGDYQVGENHIGASVVKWCWSLAWHAIAVQGGVAAGGRGQRNLVECSRASDRQRQPHSSIAKFVAQLAPAHSRSDRSGPWLLHVPDQQPADDQSARLSGRARYDCPACLIRWIRKILIDLLLLLSIGIGQFRRKSVIPRQVRMWWWTNEADSALFAKRPVIPSRPYRGVAKTAKNWTWAISEAKSTRVMTRRRANEF